MKNRFARRTLGLAGIFAITFGALGCELLLDFDRSLVDGGAITAVDATFLDAPLPDGVAPPMDSASDAPFDATGPDARDTGTDAPVDTGMDTGIDSADASDSSDAGFDVNLDGDAADG